jgi:hypothetical protein
MTVDSCNTPKYNKRRNNKGVKQLETRVIAVEAVCGPINTIFIYYTDSMVSGGANIMIEVQRQGNN